MNKTRVDIVNKTIENLLCSQFSSALFGFCLTYFWWKQPHLKPQWNNASITPNTLKFYTYAVDTAPKNCSVNDIFKAKNPSQFETCGLALLLQLKINVRIILTSNVGISDQLIKTSWNWLYKTQWWQGRSEKYYCL